MSKNKRVQDHFIFKLSLLSLSLFFLIAQSISPAIPLMYHAFPEVSHAGIELVSTIPNVGIVIGLLLNPLTIRWLGEKMTILAGLAIMVVAGIFPLFSAQYVLILISRFLLGIGVGLFNSLAVSLIPQFYSDNEDELATMVGWQGVMSNVGIAVASFIISYLVTLSWHAPFAIFLLGVPSFILFSLFVPLPRARQKDESLAGATSTKHHLTIGEVVNRRVILIAGLFFLIYVFYMTISFKLPAFVVEEKLGNVSELSTLNGALGLVAIPVGIAFGILYRHLHDILFPLSFLVLAVGFAIVSYAPNFFVLVIGTLLIGIGFGMVIPYMYNWLDWSVSKEAVNLATTIVLVVINLGAAVSPMIIDAISTSAKAAMISSCLVYGVLTVYALVHYLRTHRIVQKKSINKEVKKWVI